jgi:hypothetical protein
MSLGPLTLSNNLGAKPWGGVKSGQNEKPHRGVLHRRYTRSGETITHLASRRLDEPDASGRAHNVEPAIGVRSRPRRVHPIGDGMNANLFSLQTKNAANATKFRLAPWTREQWICGS